MSERDADGQPPEYSQVGPDAGVDKPARTIERFNAIMGSDDSVIGELVVHEIERKGLVMNKPRGLQLGPEEVERLRKVHDSGPFFLWP